MVLPRPGRAAHHGGAARAYQLHRRYAQIVRGQRFARLLHLEPPRVASFGVFGVEQSSRRERGGARRRRRRIPTREVCSITDSRRMPGLSRRHPSSRPVPSSFFSNRSGPPRRPPTRAPRRATRHEAAFFFASFRRARTDASSRNVLLGGSRSQIARAARARVRDTSARASRAVLAVASARRAPRRRRRRRKRLRPRRLLSHIFRPRARRVGRDDDRAVAESGLRNRTVFFAASTRRACSASQRSRRASRSPRRDFDSINHLGAIQSRCRYARRNGNVAAKRRVAAPSAPEKPTLFGVFVPGARELGGVIAGRASPPCPPPPRASRTRVSIRAARAFLRFSDARGTYRRRPGAP